MPAPSTSVPHDITSDLPRHSLSLLCGAPFAGKDKLLYSAITEYLASGSFLDSTAPQDAQGAPRLARVGYTGPKLLPPLSGLAQAAWSDLDDYDSTIPPTLDALYHLFAEPRPQFLIVDSIQRLMPSGKVADYCEVMRWCLSLTRWCRERDVTLLGTAPAAKLKLADGGYAPHDRIFGSVGWAQSAHTLYVLDALGAQAADSTPITSTRLLTILTHGPHPTRRIYYDIDSNDSLVPTLGTSGLSEAEWRLALTSTVSQAPDPIRTAQLLEWGASLSISKATVERWITDMLEAGRMQKLSKGQYKWLDDPHPQC